MSAIVLIRGGGDLASGVAIRLLRAGVRVAITELAQPLAVRRSVAFAQAVYAGEVSIEGIVGRRVEDPADTLRILNIFAKQQVPVIIDPECISAQNLHPSVIVDGRLTKQPPEPIGYSPMLYIGLGPGFEAGVNCQAVIETKRGHTLGRVYWQGRTEPDSRLPEGNPQRVLRAPCAGILESESQFGQHYEPGEVIARVAGQPIQAPFAGVLRGLLHPGLQVTAGMKVGDLDPRDDPAMCNLVSDKALAVGGGVLEAILTRPEVRLTLW
jgi:xanthine dehydrogenase accessory factor